MQSLQQPDTGNYGILFGALHEILAALLENLIQGLCIYLMDSLFFRQKDLSYKIPNTLSD